MLFHYNSQTRMYNARMQELLAKSRAHAQAAAEAEPKPEETPPPKPLPRVKHQNVMIIANRVYGIIHNRRQAMLQAWVLVKLPKVETRAAGVTYGNRQKLLERLSAYPPEDVTLTLRREPDNLHDPNAILIVARVRGKGSAAVGYVPRGLARCLAPILDAGRAVQVLFQGIVGGNEEWLSRGLRFEVTI